MPKSNIKFQNVPKKSTKKRKIAPLLTFPRKDFTPDRFFSPTLLARWYVFASLTAKAVKQLFCFQSCSKWDGLTKQRTKKCITWKGEDYFCVQKTLHFVMNEKIFIKILARKMHCNADQCRLYYSRY